MVLYLLQGGVQAGPALVHLVDLSLQTVGALGGDHQLAAHGLDLAPRGLLAGRELVAALQAQAN